MTRSFGLVDYKIEEAEYFLLELRRLGKTYKVRQLQFCASTFVSAARSVTFAMQASLRGNAEFEVWYEARQKELKADPLARFFHNFRTVTQHIGANVVGAVASGPNGPVHYFMPCHDIPEVPELDVISACEVYFKSVLKLVFDCYMHLGTVIDGQQYFTRENFADLGKSIEDAEEELGYPRGWTDIGKPGTEPYRWELLRRQADGCPIERQFWEWLQLSLPRPDPLPAYKP